MHKRLVQFKQAKQQRQNFATHHNDDDIDSDLDKLDSEINRDKSKSPEKKYQLNLLDMRHMLGFLNQSEWVTALNIGNIMQISPI